MDLNQWLAERRLGISGSDISVLLGVNPYKTPDDLILDKLGLSPKFEGNKATFAGQMLEPHVANAWSKREQKIIINGLFTKKGRYVGTPDFLHPFGGLEIKTGGEKIWRKGCPKYYEFQCRWYMMLFETESWDLVACIVPKDRDLIPWEMDLLEWVSSRPHREFRFERDLAWEERARFAADQFLKRLDLIRVPD